MSADGALRERLVEELGAAVRATGKSGVVVGLAGRTRDAVACALAAEAVGPDNVIALIMPVAPDDESAEGAREATAALGVRCMEVDLDAAHRTLLDALAGRRERAERLERAAGTPGPAGGDQAREASARAAIAPRLQQLATRYFGDLLDHAVLGTPAMQDAVIDPLGGVDDAELKALADALGVARGE